MPDYKLTRPRINGKRAAVWYVTWTDGRKSKRRTTGETDKARASQWLELFKTSLERPHGPWTLGRILRAYIAAKDAPQARVSANRLIPAFDHKSPMDVTQTDIDRYIKHRRKSVTESTVATELRYLRASLNWAVRYGHIDTFRPFQIPAGRAVRRRFYTRQEFDLMIAASHTMSMRLFMEIAIATASRPAKIYALQWQDIDALSKVVYFETGNKTKRTRPVPINARLAWVLGVAYQYRQSDFVIERNGKRLQTLKKQFNQLTSETNIKDAMLRDFRGTAASWALQKGAPIEMVADLMGDSVEVVQRHYGHFSPHHIASVTDLLK